MYQSKTVFYYPYRPLFDRRPVERNKADENGSKRSIEAVIGQQWIKLSFFSVAQVYRQWKPPNVGDLSSMNVVAIYLAHSAIVSQSSWGFFFQLFCAQYSKPQLCICPRKSGCSTDVLYESLDHVCINWVKDNALNLINWASQHGDIWCVSCYRVKWFKDRKGLPWRPCHFTLSLSSFLPTNNGKLGWM